MEVLQRVTWTGFPSDLGELFILRKDDWLAICKLTSHPEGWELRVYIDSPENTIATHVCRSESEVRATSARWKSQMSAKGWT